MLKTWTMEPYKALYQCSLDEQALVRSPHIQDRLKAAADGLGLDVLVYDPEPAVRAFVANKGYGLERLFSDTHVIVRQAVARNDFALDVLAEDDSPFVKKEVQNTLAREGMSYEAWEKRGRPVRNGYTLEDWVRHNPHKCAGGFNGVVFSDPNSFARFNDYYGEYISDLPDSVQKFIQTEIVWALRSKYKTLDPPASEVKEIMNGKLLHLESVCNVGPIASRLARMDSFDPHSVEIGEYAVLYLTTNGPLLCECHITEDDASPNRLAWYYDAWEQYDNGQWYPCDTGGLYWGYDNANEVPVEEAVPDAYNNILSSYTLPYEHFDKITGGELDIKKVLESIKIEGKYNRYDAIYIDGKMKTTAGENHILNTCVKQVSERGCER